MSPRVLIADDHPPTRAGIRQALEEAGFEVCDEVGTAAAAIAGALEHRPDICLLDIGMPGNGIHAAAEITRQLPETAVVMLTVSQDDKDLFDALLAGASGYLLKGIDPERLPQALRGLISGEAALPRRLVGRVLEEFRAREGRKRRLPRGRGEGLTSREWEVLQLLREGKSSEEISERLYIAPVTVRTHVSAILRKLRVPDREAAIHLLDEER